LLAGIALSAAVAALVAGPWIRDMSRSGLVRDNYAGRQVAFPGGAVLIACSLIALAPLAFLDDRADLDLLAPELRRWAVFILGMAMLGLLDDSLGRGARRDTPRGWRGHARAILDGRFSTGAIKAIGALALAAYAASGRGQEGFDYVRDLALLLLATNLFNLLDLRPGRVEKVFALLLAGLCLGAWTLEPLEIVGVFVGPVAVVAYFTMREHVMLGDTGSNLVGAIAAVAMLETLGEGGRWVALGLVAALTIYGEFRSITATIERNGPLRALDELGRPDGRRTT
jgi:UDP-N-acetylmuramyl pentapeptide phosphotransferase/UDP-N-acetylglucosamine-1-phosphate transferase